MDNPDPSIEKLEEIKQEIIVLQKQLKTHMNLLPLMSFALILGFFLVRWIVLRFF